MADLEPLQKLRLELVLEMVKHGLNASQIVDEATRLLRFIMGGPELQSPQFPAGTRVGAGGLGGIGAASVVLVRGIGAGISGEPLRGVGDTPQGGGAPTTVIPSGAGIGGTCSTKRGD